MEESDNDDYIMTPVDLPSKYHQLKAQNLSSSYIKDKSTEVSNINSSRLKKEKQAIRSKYSTEAYNQLRLAQPVLTPYANQVPKDKTFDQSKHSIMMSIDFEPS